MPSMKFFKWAPTWYVWDDTYIPFYGQPLFRPDPEADHISGVSPFTPNHFAALDEGVLLAPSKTIEIFFLHFEFPCLIVVVNWQWVSMKFPCFTVQANSQTFGHSIQDDEKELPSHFEDFKGKQFLPKTVNIEIDSFCYVFRKDLLKPWFSGWKSVRALL